MSFGDGNLHERCEQYRRQLGAANERERRLRQQLRNMEDQLFEERQRHNRLHYFAAEAWRDIREKGRDEFLLFGWYESEARELALEGRWQGVEVRRVDNG